MDNLMGNRERGIKCGIGNGELGMGNDTGQAEGGSQFPGPRCTFPIPLPVPRYGCAFPIPLFPFPVPRRGLISQTPTTDQRIGLRVGMTYVFHPAPVIAADTLGSALPVPRCTFPIPFPVPRYGYAFPIPLFPFPVLL